MDATGDVIGCRLGTKFTGWESLTVTSAVDIPNGAMMFLEIHHLLEHCCGWLQSQPPSLDLCGKGKVAA